MTLVRKQSIGTESDDPMDAVALRRLAGGETSALATIYDRHHVALRRFVSQATNNAHDVDDLLHATFLTAAKAAAAFDGRESCRPWLFGIAVRLLQRRRRTLSRWSRALHEFAIRQGAVEVDPHRELAARDDLRSLSVALGKLSDAKRIALCLAEIEGLSSDEIARVLRIPVGTVWTRLHHARRELRELMRGSEP